MIYFNLKTFVFAALACLWCGVTASSFAEDARPDRMIADFEGGTYGEWKATGDAFGDKPAGGTLYNQQKVSGFTGKGLVNTYLKGDKTTGTLESPALTLDRLHLVFLIGGGGHEGTCLQLLIDGEVVAQASGMDNEQLMPAAFDLAEYQGKQANLRIVDTETGKWGHVNVDDIRLTDIRPKNLVGAYARTFEVSKDLLVLPIKNGARAVKVELLVEGQAVRRYGVGLATDPNDVDWYAYFTIAGYKGKQATIKASVATEEAFALIQQTDTYPGEELKYDEALRPQLRFSQRVGWINDPNGMVYHDGEWHFFFQHNPVGRGWGNMTWGHAISKDLIHWEQLPNALFPKTMLKGDAFSGGGTSDPKNTAGWKTGDNDVLVVFYTDTGLGECVAYSNDNGRTFTQYEGNPIITHKGRDPKAIWYAYDKEDTPLNDRARELGGHWVLFVYCKDEEHGQHTAFYTSTNLKDWELASRLKGYYECPELFELPVEGLAGETRWVTFAADARYAVGTFDGKTFTPEHKGKHRVHHGPYYASQTFDNAPDGRRIQVGFSGFGGATDLPGMAFNKTFNVPHELTLHKTADGIRMHAKPIEEIKQLRKKHHAAAAQMIKPGEPVVLPVEGDLFEVHATFQAPSTGKVGIEFGGDLIVYDADKGTLNGAPLKPVDGKIQIQAIVDRPMLDIAGNDGAVYITAVRNHPGQVQQVKAYVEANQAKLVEMDVYELRSIWR